MKKKLMALAATCLVLAAGTLAQTPIRHTQGPVAHPRPAVAGEPSAVKPADSQEHQATGADWLLAVNRAAEQQKNTVTHTQTRTQGATPHTTDATGEQFPFLFKHMGVSELKNLGMSDEQIQQINQVYQVNRDRLNQLNAEVRQKENDLRFLLDSSQVDSAQAEQQVDALTEARGRLSKATTMMMVQMRHLMNAEQWFKLSELQRRLPPATPIPHVSVPPPSLAPGVYRPGRDGVSAPQLRMKVEPEYTENARTQHIEGAVVLYAVVGTDGVPFDIRVARSLAPELDQKAIEAVTQWRFSPGRKDGQPVNVAATIEITFRLK